MSIMFGYAVLTGLIGVFCLANTWKCNV